MTVEVDFKILGRTISACRKSAHMTQQALAERIDVSTQFIGNIERGVSTPSLSTICKISVALEQSLNDLMAASIVRIIEDTSNHTLKDAAAGYCNTLTQQMLSSHTLSDAPLAPGHGILYLDENLF